jgi:hypothetical protein
VARKIAVRQFEQFLHRIEVLFIGYQQDRHDAESDPAFKNLAQVVNSAHFSLFYCV